MLESVDFLGVEGDRVRLKPHAGHRADLLEPRLGWLAQTARELLGRDIQVVLESDAEMKNESEVVTDARVLREAMQDPIVRKAAELFEGRVVRVEEESGDGAT